VWYVSSGWWTTAGGFCPYVPPVDHFIEETAADVDKPVNELVVARDGLTRYRSGGQVMNIVVVGSLMQSLC